MNPCSYEEPQLSNSLWLNPLFLPSSFPAWKQRSWLHVTLLARRSCHPIILTTSGEPAKSCWIVLCDPDGRGSNMSLNQGPQKELSRFHLDLYTNNMCRNIRLVKIRANRYPWRYRRDASSMYVTRSYIWSITNYRWTSKVFPNQNAAIAVGKGPNGIGVDSSGDKLYVANSGDNTISVIDEAMNSNDRWWSNDKAACRSCVLLLATGFTY